MGTYSVVALALGRHHIKGTRLVRQKRTFAPVFGDLDANLILRINIDGR
jgi:hypothetical protein